jgi:ubiquinone/menaquinone biosynthesis C-methylase UbiE
MQSTKLVETWGCVDLVALEQNVLHIEGWVGSIKGGSVDGFIVCCGGKELTEFELTKGIFSPDVKAAFPNLDCSENARFNIRVPLNQEEHQQVQNSLLSLTPLLGDHQGYTLLNIIEPSIPLPSEENSHLVGGNFLRVAFEFLGHLVNRAGLQRTDKVLDVGCGTGRIAYALTYYLSPVAGYEGFDIVEQLIQWAQQTITPRFPNFNFRKVDIYNHYYNPTGTLRAAEFIFPYEDENFDFVFLTSVFTHMQAQEVYHYLEEIHRVLKPGGRCLCTCFLLNEQSERLIAEGKSSQNLVYELKECFTTNPEVPESVIGYKESLLLQWMVDYGLTVQAKYYGVWCGRDEFTSYQDILVLQKE